MCVESVLASSRKNVPAPRKPPVKQAEFIVSHLLFRDLILSKAAQKQQQQKNHLFFVSRTWPFCFIINIDSHPMHKFLKHHLYCIAHLLKFKMLQIAKSLCFCYKQTCSPLVLVSEKQRHQWTSGSVLCSMHRPCHCEGRAENLFLRKSLAGSEYVQAMDWNGGVYTHLEHMETDAKISFLQVQLADLEHFW